jgi:hypothetical protein
VAVAELLCRSECCTVNKQDSWLRGLSEVLRAVSVCKGVGYCSGNQIEKNEMGRACSMYGAKREVHTVFWWGDLREGDHLRNAGVDRMIILKWIFKTWDWGMDWIELAQDRDRWRALVNAAMNLRVP